MSNRDSVRSPLPHLLDIVAVAEHLGVTVRHVRRLVAERRIPLLKWGHLLLFDPYEIADWLESTRVRPAEPTPLCLTPPLLSAPTGELGSRTTPCSGHATSRQGVSQ